MSGAYDARASAPSGTLVPASGSPFAAGANPFSMAVGDFNRDGKLDIVVVNRSVTNGTVTVLLGNGAGGFTISGTFPVGDAPGAIATGDFNGDGALDLVVTNYNSNSVSVLLGDGHGAFRPAPGSPIFTPVFMRPVSVAVADFNRDGRLDLAIGSLFGGVTVWLGNGTGGFALAPGSPFSAGNGPASLAVADFNGDGKPDLAVANFYGSKVDPTKAFPYEVGTTVTVLLGNGIGGFTTAPGSPLTVGTEPTQVVAGDLNGDGKPDLAVVNFESKNVTILLGNGLGGFTAGPGSPWAAGYHPDSIVIADLNGDGSPDLAVANQDSGDITVLLGNAFGGFTSPFGGSFATGVAPVALFAADFNGDGRVDLAFAGIQGGVNVWLGSTATTSTLLSTTSSTTVTPGQAIALSAQVTVWGRYFTPPTGLVTFQDGASRLAAVPLSGGIAAFTVTTLAPGSHTFTAVYSGDDRNSASISNALFFTPPPILINGVANGASFLPGVAAPNTILSLFGTNLGCASMARVLLNGVSAEILGTTDTQINFVVPPSLSAGNASLQVTCGTNLSQPYPIPSSTAAPAIFTVSRNGVGQAAVLNQDGSLNGPLSPAARGDYISLFATGFGVYGDTDLNGLRWLIQPVAVYFADVQGSVQFAGAAPGYTLGLQQINAQIPAGAPSGDAVAIRMTAGDASTQQPVTVAIK